MKLISSKAKTLSLSAAILLIFATSIQSEAQIAYTVQNLGTLPNGSWSIATQINNCGDVIGVAGGYNYIHAVVWHDGVIKDLNTLSNVESYALGINDKGQIAGWGYSPIPPFYEHPFVWDKTNGMHNIGLPPYGLYAYAYGINNVGQVVGESGIGAFMYDGTMHNLPGQYGSAKAINELGQIVGYASKGGDGGEHAVLWQDGKMTYLGELYYDPWSSPHSRSYANDINDSGQIVGQSSVDKNVGHAFLYDNGTMTDLDTLGSYDSNAMSINSQGQIVGWSLTASGYHAFLNDGTGMHVLNDLISENSGWELFSATGINDQGQIVGRGNQGAFLLTPINSTGGDPSSTPEPHPLPLLAGVAVSCLILIRRKHHS